MTKDVPASKLLPLRSKKHLFKVMPYFVVGERNRLQALLPALWDFRLQAKRKPTSRMASKPIFEHAFQKWRHWHAAERMPAANPFSLANENSPMSEIEVLDLRAAHFAAPCARVGGKDEHWIKERMIRSRFHGAKYLRYLGQCEKCRVPELRGLFLGHT